MPPNSPTLAAMVQEVVPTQFALMTADDVGASHVLLGVKPVAQLPPGVPKLANLTVVITWPAGHPPRLRS